jgi:hypothetical protein
MAEEKSLRVKLILGATKGKPVRFSYLNVFKAKLNTESGKYDFSVAVLIPKTNTEDVAAIKAAIKDLQQDMWLSKKKPLPPKFWYPLRDGDTDTKQNGDSLGEAAKGCYVLNCKTGAEDEEGNPKDPPEVIGTQKDERGRRVALTRREVKSGDWGRVSINMGAYTKGTGGAGAYLNSVQKTKAGDPLANVSSAEDDFGSFEDEEDDDDAMMG